MHITAILKFINDHPIAKTENLTTSEINSNFVKPETKGTNQSYSWKYVDLKDETTGVPLVSTATVFVSHAWRYAFCDVGGDVMEQYAIKYPDTYVWFDLFMNDQSEMDIKDFDWFSSIFKNIIRDIGQVLLVLSPWDDPMPIKRECCLFQIHNALQQEGSCMSLCVKLRSYVLVLWRVQSV